METMLAVILGLGLSASCGFRVFVPLLVTSVAALAGYLDLANGFEWIGTWSAFAAFAAASLLEVAAYYIPWLDNLLDTIASPMGVIAGIVLFAASVTELDPFLHWSLAIIAGGGSAGVVQGGTIMTRAASTVTTGGLANFVVNTLETLAGFFFSIMSIAFPLLASTGDGVPTNITINALPATNAPPAKPLATSTAELSSDDDLLADLGLLEN